MKKYIQNILLIPFLGVFFSNVYAELLFDPIQNSTEESGSFEFRIIDSEYRFKVEDELSSIELNATRRLIGVNQNIRINQWVGSNLAIAYISKSTVDFENGLVENLVGEGGAMIGLGFRGEIPLPKLAPVQLVAYAQGFAFYESLGETKETTEVISPMSTSIVEATEIDNTSQYGAGVRVGIIELIPLAPHVDIYLGLDYMLYNIAEIKTESETVYDDPDIESTSSTSYGELKLIDQYGVRFGTRISISKLLINLDANKTINGTSVSLALNFPF